MHITDLVEHNGKQLYFHKSFYSYEDVYMQCVCLKVAFGLPRKIEQKITQTTYNRLVL